MSETQNRNSSTPLVRWKVGSGWVECLENPRGRSGTMRGRYFEGETADSASAPWISISWLRDLQGIWIELPHGVFGFDIQVSQNEEGQKIVQVSERKGHRLWEGVTILHESELSTKTSGQASKRKVKIKAQMPGKILKVLVREGDAVVSGQPLLVMEAMKMENEIKAPQAGVIAQLRVQPGQNVETGSELCNFE